MSIIVLLLCAQSPALVPVPYHDPLGRRPSTYEEYAACLTDAPYQTEVRARLVSGRDTRLVLVLVNAGLYPAIEDELSTYLADVAGSGFDAKLITVFGGRPADLRSTLQAHRDSGLAAGVMVGDLPVAWWEDSEYGEDYPIDLFFTDLDGTFADNDGDGKYDRHSGNTAPDIRLGRIYASRFTYGGEAELVRSYFRRNHAYRTGQMTIPRRAMAYNEVDWYPNDHGLGNLYSDVTVFNDQNITTAHHYRGQLVHGYEFIHIIAHSSPWVHSFFLQNDEFGAGSVFNFELPALCPRAAFYFVNGCMSGRFTERDNLGNWYLFAQPWALEVMASSQLMYGVNSLATVYQALSRDSTFGAAFLAWHRTNYASFQGTCLLGDPTLRVNRAEPQAVRVNPPHYTGAAPTDWSVYDVENSDFVNGHPAIGAAQGRIRIAFDSGRRVRSDTYISSFTGAGFTLPESVAWHEYYDLFPTCATDAAGRFWVAWQSFRDYSSYEHFQVFTARYYNGQWSSVSRVGPQAGYHDVQPDLASGTDTMVWCAFKSWRNGQADIWVSNAYDGGAWSTPVRLTMDSLDQVDPCVVVDRDNHPWVFWTSLANGRWQLHGRKYDNGWQPVFVLDSFGDNSSPRAAVDQVGRLWVVWHKWQGAQADVYYAWFDSVWSAPAPLTASPTDDVLPDIAAATDGTVWACWQSRATGHWDVYTSCYADGWSEPEPLVLDTANDYDPVIVADTGGIWVAWASDRRGYWNIRAAHNSLTGVNGRARATTPLVRAMPNPFRDKTLFFGPATFSVDMFAADGRRVARLEGRNGTAIWPATGLAPGVYVAHVAGSTIRLVLAR